MGKRLIKILLFAILFNLSQFALTRAVFTDTDNIDGHKIDTGYWVPPEVEVESPNGGEVYDIGEEIEISWNAEASYDGATIEIDIYLSTDSGSTYPTQIVNDTENDGSYFWVLPDQKSDTMRIKVVATDDQGMTGEDESDGDFDPVTREEEKEKEKKEDEQKSIIQDQGQEQEEVEAEENEIQGENEDEGQNEEDKEEEHEDDVESEEVSE